jgi:hypothetical protein
VSSSVSSVCWLLGFLAQVGDPSLQRLECLIEILGFRILEDDFSFTLVYRPDYKSLPLFDADLDPPQGLDPAGHRRIRLVEFLGNRENRHVPSDQARL